MYSLALPQQNRISSVELFFSHSHSIIFSPSAFLTLFITLSSLSGAQSIETFSLAHSQCGRKSFHSISVCVIVYTRVCESKREKGKEREKWERDRMCLAHEDVPPCDGRYDLQNRGVSLPLLVPHCIFCLVVGADSQTAAPHKYTFYLQMRTAGERQA